MLHQLGAGTLGPVYRAYDPERDRLVAVKLFTLDLPPERVHQLVDEFQRLVAAELIHPGIAAPVAAGIVGVSAYLAQEYVSAESLDLAVREYGPAPPADAIRVLTQLAGALDFAAVVNITHGAMHPRDVLLSGEETRLTGIGVASALERVGVSAPIRRPYTAPERVAGRGWDRRADIFTLAALIHELLWGRRITGTGAQAAATLGELHDADMRALHDVFACALADDPVDRFGSALEFAEVLRNAFPDQTLVRPASATAETSLESAHRTDRQRAAPPRSSEALPTVRRLPLSDPEPMAPLPVHADDVELPIAPTVDESTDETIPMATTPGASTVGELELRQSEDERYADVESAPAVAPAAGPRRADPDETIAENDLPTVAERDQPTVASGMLAAAERPPSRTGAMFLTLLVGVLIGFAAGYLVGTGPPATTREPSRPAQPAPTVQSRPAPAPTPPAPGAREFTEGSVSEAKPNASAAERKPEGQAPSAAAVPQQASPQVPPPTPPEREGRILVRSTPAGATVFVDGRDAGRTPTAVRDLARGTHRVRIALDGYVAEERSVAITRARPAQAMTVSLSPRRAAPTRATQGREPTPDTPGTMGRYSGSLMVESRPTAADVFVDNRLIGKTPVLIDSVPVGEHVIRLERQGYQRWSGQVRVTAAERTRVTASLEER